MGWVGFVALAMAVSLLLIRLSTGQRKKKTPEPSRTGQANEKTKPLPHGSVSVLRDTGGNVDIIPFATGRGKAGRACGEPTRLSAPVTTLQLALATRQMLDVSEKAKTELTSEALMSTLGFRTWQAYSEGKINLSVCWKDGKGLVLNSTWHLADGSYMFRVQGYEEVLSADCTDLAFGQMLETVLKRCK